LGDGSLCNVIAHELAHSWTGNLVTNKTWDDFWLNEGFTVFVERKIVGRVYGEHQAELQALIGLKDLEEDITVLNTPETINWTKLQPDLTGIDPDDAFSSIPYEKGFNFLYFLETITGGPVNFEPWLKEYVKEVLQTN